MESLDQKYQGIQELRQEIKLKLVSIEQKFKKLLRNIDGSPVKPAAKNITFQVNQDLTQSTRSSAKSPRDIKSSLSLKAVNIVNYDRNDSSLLSPYYPGTDIKRFEVETRYKSWSIPWPEYKPVIYTSQSIILNPKADIDQLS